MTSEQLNLLTFLMVSYFCGIILVVDRASYVTHTCTCFLFFNFSTDVSLFNCLTVWQILQKVAPRQPILLEGMIPFKSLKKTRKNKEQKNLVDNENNMVASKLCNPFYT